LYQKSNLVFLHVKGLSAKAKVVRTELVHMLGSDAIAYSTVTKYIGNDAILQDEAKDRAWSGSSTFLDYRQCNSGGT
jgi:hypothetical protein